VELWWRRWSRSKTPSSPCLRTALMPLQTATRRTRRPRASMVVLEEQLPLLQGEAGHHRLQSARAMRPGLLLSQKRIGELLPRHQSTSRRRKRTSPQGSSGRPPRRTLSTEPTKLMGKTGLLLCAYSRTRTSCRSRTTTRTTRTA